MKKIAFDSDDMAVRLSPISYNKNHFLLEFIWLGVCSLHPKKPGQKGIHMTQWQRQILNPGVSTVKVILSFTVFLSKTETSAIEAIDVSFLL